MSGQENTDFRRRDWGMCRSSLRSILRGEACHGPLRAPAESHPRAPTPSLPTRPRPLSTHTAFCAKSRKIAAGQKWGRSGQAVRGIGPGRAVAPREGQSGSLWSCGWIHGDQGHRVIINASQINIKYTQNVSNAPGLERNPAGGGGLVPRIAAWAWDVGGQV